MAVKPIPEGYQTVDSLKQAFGATELHRFADSDGTIRHAEVKIGDSTQ